MLDPHSTKPSLVLILKASDRSGFLPMTDLSEQDPEGQVH